MGFNQVGTNKVVCCFTTKFFQSGTATGHGSSFQEREHIHPMHMGIIIQENFENHKR